MKCCKHLILGLSLLSLTLISVSEATAADYEARVMRSKKKDKRIQGLKFKSSKVSVRTELKSTEGGQEFVAYAEVSGELKKKGYDLYWKDQRILASEYGDPNFTFEFPLKSDRTPFTIFVVSQDGTIEKEQILIRFDEWYDAEGETRKKPTSRSSLVPSVGFTRVNYKETNKQEYAGNAITLKASYRYVLFPPNWDLGLSAYANVYPFGDKQPTIDARFYGFNARLGYVIPSINEPWRISILAGWFYTTMMVTNNAFGYKNISGPQLYPTIRRGLSDGKSIFFNFKFSPLLDKFKLLPFKNRELAAGAGLIMALSNNHPLIFSVDFSQIKILFGTVASESVAYSVGVGYGF